MGRVIVFTSGKGGVGKTTVCANLGYALAKIGKRVLMLDGDFGLNNLDVIMGVENKCVYDIVDVLSDHCRPRQALIQDFFQENLYILPSNHTFLSENLDYCRIKSIIDELANSFDFVLLDCPAGIEEGFFRVVKCATESIVVTTPHLSALRDCDKVIGILNSLNMPPKLVLNRVRGDMQIDGDMLDINTIKEYLNVDILGVLPDDDNIVRQLNTGGMLSCQSDVGVAFDVLADNMLNDKSNIFDCTKKYRGLFGSIKKSLKKVL